MVSLRVRLASVERVWAWVRSHFRKDSFLLPTNSSFLRTARRSGVIGEGSVMPSEAALVLERGIAEQRQLKPIGGKKR